METIVVYGMANFTVEILQGFTVFHNQATEVLCHEMGLRGVNSKFDFVFFLHIVNEMNR